MIHILLAAPPASGEAVLEGAAAHHVARVLRARPGEEVTACDGRGGRYRGTVTEAGRDRVALLLRSTAVEPLPTPSVRVIVPLVSGDRTAWAVEKLVELGAGKLAPFVATRGARRPADPARVKARLAAVAWAAAEQSRRAWLAEVDAPVPLAEALARAESPVLAADTENAAPLSAALETYGGQRALTLATGPEGGWDRAERATLAAAGATRVTLGRTVLRAETAPVALLAACAFYHGMLDGIPDSG